MTLKSRRHRMLARVWFNGVEVTDGLLYADSRRGVIRGYCTDEKGAKHGGYEDLTGRSSRYRLQRFEARGRVRVGIAKTPSRLGDCEASRRLRAMVPQARAEVLRSEALR